MYVDNKGKEVKVGDFIEYEEYAPFGNDERYSKVRKTITEDDIQFLLDAKIIKEVFLDKKEEPEFVKDNHIVSVVTNYLDNCDDEEYAKLCKILYPYIHEQED